MIYYFSLPVQGISVMPEKQKKKNKNDNHIKESFTMKLLLVCLAVLLLALAVLLLKNTLQRKKLPLQLTEKIYAVPGIECNIYFNNVVTAINYRNYAYEVRCDIGRTDSDRWRVTPEEKDIGEHKLTLIVHGDDGIVARATTTVVVAAPITEKKKVSLLLMGASQTAAVGYPERIFELMKAEKNVDFTMVGTNSGGYAAPVPGGVAHEGYGGWGWNSFFTRYGLKESSANDGLDPARPWIRNSSFLFPDGDGFKFDLKAYCDKYNQGNVPDTLIIMLGINNIFGARSNSDIDKTWDEHIYPYMKKLVGEFRKLNPSIHIAFCTLTPGSFTQTSFGKSYNCNYTLWQWRRNLCYYHEKLFKVVKELNVGLIPVHAVVDGDNGYPEQEEAANMHCGKKILRQMNAVHPNPSGYKQIGDCIFAYLKHILSSR